MKLSGCSSPSTPVTSQFGDRLTHQVFDHHAARRSGTGLLRAVCGQWIIPSPMMPPRSVRMVQDVVAALVATGPCILPEEKFSITRRHR
jgi:hypothetical protein